GLDELKKISPRFERDVCGYLAVETSVDRKASYGGTARKRVEEQLARLQKELRK
ncbi:MAG: argininosuccinate lyase, partial [Nitrospinae bacterium CG11_big_fil_rev_8_21_14_0_20_56_8]